MFKTVPKYPYSYQFKGEGAAVGTYHPNLNANHPIAPRVPIDHFVEKHHPVIIPDTKYPKCTQNGNMYCSLKSRKQHKSNRLKSRLVTTQVKLDETSKLSKKNTNKTLDTERSAESKVETHRTAKIEDDIEPQMRHVFSEANLDKIRNFKLMLSRDKPKNVFNGIHPGKPDKACVNEKQFENTNEKLMRGSKYRRTQGD